MVLLIAFEVNILTADHELHMQYEFRAQVLTSQRNTQITLTDTEPRRRREGAEQLTVSRNDHGDTHSGRLRQRENVHQ
ncbi:hypothetical protein B9Q03_14675 [Candidatus Marsarchaeota G2 archaeon OSP_D]|uniref:Uncharacterized protein n=1 Tax=Candidatus Marsarchaeota G2 archaeon OSP_D TaxID=1978157 RepID=A0A2R6A6K9_9ARCH|nr:MAG: hypothetical protein B9Q03_14675 [Candidatus Marsarchaeota G2 archaeon OSP_D]